MIGQVAVDLVASATVPDFDLWAQLFDVAPDGTAWNLSTAGTALQRASYRGGGPQRRLIKPGETVRLRMEGMVTANRFLKGHRLRLNHPAVLSVILSQPADRSAGVRQRQRAAGRDSHSIRVAGGTASGRSLTLLLENCDSRLVTRDFPRTDA